MKNSTRLRIASDMVLQKKWQYRISVLILIVTMIFVGLMTSFFVEANYYMDTINRGISVNKNQVGEYYVDTKIDEEDIQKSIFDEIKMLNGVHGIGCYSTRYISTYSCLSDIASYQKEVWSLDGEKEPGVRKLWFSDSLWKMFPLKLSEGKEPWEYDGDYTLIYLGSDFNGLVKVGDVFEDRNSDGELINSFYVAGILEEGCWIMNETVTDSVQQNMSGSLVTDPWMIEITPDWMIWNNQYFYISDTADRTEIEEQMVAIADKYGVSIKIHWLGNALEYIEKENQKMNSYLFDITLLLGITSVILIVCSQVISILVRAEEFGIWYSCGATNKDMILVLIYQNMNRIIAPLIIGGSINYIILYKLYFVLNSDKSVLNQIFWMVVIPVMLLMATIIVVLCSAISVYVLSRKHPMEMLRGDV